MKYMGSKSRIAKEIVPIIQRYVDISDKKYYLEPFCGGCNVIQHIHATKRYAFDKQKYLIALFNNLDKIEQLPDFVTKEHYEEVKRCYLNNSKKFPDWYVGMIGFLASYNGKFFEGSYAGKANTKIGTVRNYYDEAKRNLQAQIPLLGGIKFRCASYTKIKNIKGYVIYCDPPYKGTTQYGINKNFNHEIFWNWIRKMSENNVVIVSEHNAPDDFECIWEKKIKRTISNQKHIDATEKLFMYLGDNNV